MLLKKFGPVSSSQAIYATSRLLWHLIHLECQLPRDLSYSVGELFYRLTVKEYETREDSRPCDRFYDRCMESWRYSLNGRWKVHVIIRPNATEEHFTHCLISMRADRQVFGDVMRSRINVKYNKEIKYEKMYAFFRGKLYRGESELQQLASECGGVSNIVFMVDLY